MYRRPLTSALFLTPTILWISGFLWFVDTVQQVRSDPAIGAFNEKNIERASDKRIESVSGKNIPQKASDDVRHNADSLHIRKGARIWSDETVDAIVVLTGGSLRLDAGLALLSAKTAPRLFVSGVHDGISVQQLLRLSHRKSEALDCCITLGYAATDTRGNAAETAAWMLVEQYQSLLLVTANYHMPRSLLEFRHALPFVKISTYPVSPPHVPLEKWWSNPGTGLLLFEEYNKYLIAYARLLISAAVGSNRFAKDS